MSASSAVPALLRDLGPGLDALPWSSPREAMSSLSASRRAAVRRFAQQLGESWLSPRPELELLRQLELAAPGNMVGLHPGVSAAGVPWLVHTRGMGKAEDDPIENQRLIAATCLYDPTSRDAFSDRPVALGPLIRRTPVSIDPLSLVDGVLHPNRLFHQLRMVLYQGGRLRLFVGLYREQVNERFDADDHASMLALRPALAEWVRVARAIGLAALGDGALVTALGAIDQPALLLRRGRVVFANALGQRWLGRVKEWSRTSPRDPRFASTVRLCPGGLEVELVLVRNERVWDSASRLTPALVPVGEAMAEGLSDKEIAERLRLPLRTARTYAQRVLARLQISDRRELIRRRH
jgi:DNA-binding CsgD family transcriptional regulator